LLPIDGMQIVGVLRSKRSKKKSQQV